MNTSTKPKRQNGQQPVYSTIDETKITHIRKNSDGTFSASVDNGTNWVLIAPQTFKALSVTYDNTSSGLVADNVQFAIDLVNSKIEYNKITNQGHVLTSIQEALDLLVDISIPKLKNAFVTFTSESARTITPKYTQSGVTLQYSLDTENWINIASGKATPSATVHYFRGVATSKKSLYAENSGYLNSWTLPTASNKCKISGNLNYLLCDTFGGHAPTILDDYCYSNMFMNCQALTSAPELPATTLAKYCYHNMFRECKNITSAPELPATTLAEDCYSHMFYDCHSLTTAPELPATTLADRCYRNMFMNCQALTSAPELPATTLANQSYDNMFNGCASLNYIKVYFSNWSLGDTSNWVLNVQTNGQFVCPSTLPNTRGDSYIPNNWTKVNV